METNLAKRSCKTGYAATNSGVPQILAFRPVQARQSRTVGLALLVALANAQLKSIFESGLQVRNVIDMVAVGIRREH